MEKKLTLLNKFVADLAVMNIKLHNLHWNVSGMNFMEIHHYTEDLYNDLFAKYDDVAEHIRIFGDYPLASMKQYLAHTGIEEIETSQINDRQVLQILINDLTYLRQQALEIRNLADQEDSFTTVALFEDYVADFDKRLWMLQAMVQ